MTEKKERAIVKRQAPRRSIVPRPLGECTQEGSVAEELDGIVAEEEAEEEAEERDGCVFN